MNQKRDIDTGCLGGGEGLVPIRIGGNQTFTIHHHPLVRICGAVFLDPAHFATSITGRDETDGRFWPQAIREA